MVRALQLHHGDAHREQACSGDVGVQHAIDVHTAVLPGVMPATGQFCLGVTAKQQRHAAVVIIRDPIHFACHGPGARKGLSRIGLFFRHGCFFDMGDDATKIFSLKLLQPAGVHGKPRMPYRVGKGAGQ